MAKNAGKPARPTSGRVQGIDSTVSDMVLRSTGRNLSLELGPAIIPIPKLTRTIGGASSIEMEIEDPEHRLLRHSLVAEKWEVEVDGLRFRYPGALSKHGDLLTLTLEDRWIALLREKKGPKRAVRGSGKGQMTRAEFIKVLVEEACGKGLRFYCPQLHRVQPIKTASHAKKAKKEAKENRRKGIGDVKGLTIDGAPASKAQIELGDTALRIAESGNAPDICQVAVIAALMDESSMGEAAPGNVLEALEPYTKVRNAAEEISGFLFGEPTWTGVTAVGYAKAHPRAKFYEIAQAVQKSGAGESTNGAANYGKFGDEARKWVEAFGGGELSESIEVTEPYEFKITKKEDYWSAIKSLAKEVNWRAFIVGDVFYYVPEPELLQGEVRLAIDGSTPGIENVDFEFDGAHPVTEVDIEAYVAEHQQDGKRWPGWTPPPGSVVTLADYGPASIGFGSPPVKKNKQGQKEGISDNRNAQTGEGMARLIVSSIEVPLSDDPEQRLATVKAHRPTPPLPEPAAEKKSVSTSKSGGGKYVNPFPHGEWTRSRTDMGVDFVNNSAASKILAIGDAKILQLGAPGWPGEGGVLYELLNGSHQGDIIYVYENVLPHVTAGQTVEAGDTIATMKGTGYPWLEIGFADAGGSPLSSGEYTEGKETGSGKKMAKWLDELGAP